MVELASPVVTTDWSACPMFVLSHSESLQTMVSAIAEPGKAANAVATIASTPRITLTRLIEHPPFAGNSSELLLLFCGILKNPKASLKILRQSRYPQLESEPSTPPRDSRLVCIPARCFTTIGYVV